MQTPSRRVRLALDAWPLAAAVVLVWPLLTRPGHPLARDLVFLPSQPLTDASLGVGSAAPRAVPLDALMSLATLVVDGGVVARAVLPLLLAAAGWGAHRLVRDLGAVARLVAGGLAVWNPYVVERLALGQWALLAGYAALPWLAMAATRHRRTGEVRDLAPVVLWTAVASITPTGGLLGLATALVFGRPLRVLPVALALQLPWLLPAVLGPAGVTSDPAGVAAFAARAEGPGGVVASVLGMGGVWDAGSVPGTRETWWGTLAAAVVVLSLVIAARELDRRWVVLAAAGLVLSLATSAPWGADLLAWLVGQVPGAGLLRDSQKFLAPFVVLAVVAVARCVDGADSRVRRWGTEIVAATGVLAVALPVLLLPDATGVVWPTVDPVVLPASVVRLDETLAGTTDEVRVAVLPWRSYRKFSWGNGLISSDPAVRLLDAEVVVSDDLPVGDTLVRGESSLARRVGEHLEDAPISTFPEIDLVVVWRDDSAADEVDLTGLDLVSESPEVAVYASPGGFPRPAESDPGRTAMLVVDLVLLALVLAAGVLRVLPRKAAGRTRRW